MYKAASNDDSQNQTKRKQMWEDFRNYHFHGIVPVNSPRIEEVSFEGTRSIKYFDPSVIVRRDDGQK